MEFEKHVKVRQEKFGAVVFDTLREKVFVTNETGAEILCLFNEGKEPETVIAELAEKYGRDSARIKHDVNDFILTLKDKGIVKKG